MIWKNLSKWEGGPALSRTGGEGWQTSRTATVMLSVANRNYFASDGASAINRQTFEPGLGPLMVQL